MLRDRVAVMGLRFVAREVGMSPTGVRKVLNGSNPYQTTSTKLEQWAARHRAGQYDTARDAALEALLQGMPYSRRDRAREQIAAILRGDDPCAGPGRSIVGSARKAGLRRLPNS